MEGPLSKWTNVVKGWQYRWFVLDDNTGLLSYYTVSISFTHLSSFVIQCKYDSYRLKKDMIFNSTSECRLYKVSCMEYIFREVLR